MNVIKFQGIGFCALAFLFTILISSTKLLSGSAEVVFLVVMIASLGLPHGALDTLFAKNRFQLNTFKKWNIFIIIYLAIAALVLEVWILFPILFLISFLTISVFHFAGDPERNSDKDISFLSRVLYGGAIIFLPTLLHAEEVLRLFSFLVKPQGASPVVQFMHILAWPWIFGLSVICLLRFKKDWLTSLEMISVALLALFVSPLAAFTVFFCGMHSARHMLRMLQLTKSLSQSTFRIFIAASILPTLAVSLVGMVVYFFPTETSVDARVVQIVFVGLAALTVPHMILLEGSAPFFYKTMNSRKLSEKNEVLLA